MVRSKELMFMEIGQGRFQKSCLKSELDLGEGRVSMEYRRTRDGAR